jgi:uncharacterized protein YjbI with pentapeptide repeats
MGKPPVEPYPPDVEEGAEQRGLEFGDLVDAVVEEADWSNERTARSVAWWRAELRRCRLTGAELGEAELRDVSFVECRLDLAGLRFAKLERVVFSECRLEECDLYEAKLADVLFDHCTLREATFTGASLRRVELRGCELAGLHGVDALRGARLPWADVVANAPLFAHALGIEILD